MPPGRNTIAFSMFIQYLGLHREHLMDTAGTILVFSENPGTGKALMAVLAKLGLTDVAVATSPHEAAKVLFGGKMRLAVIDHVPGSSQTVALIKALREQERTRLLPLLILAEPGEKALAAFAAKDERTTCVAKPLAAQAFTAALKNLLAQAKAPGAPAKDAAPGASPSDQALRDLALLLRDRKGAEAVILAESLITAHGTRTDLLMALALARHLLGETDNYVATLSRIIGTEPDTPEPARQDQPAAAAAPASGRGNAASSKSGLRGVWASLPPPERRQKARQLYSPSHAKRNALRIFTPFWSAGAPGGEGRLQLVDLSFGGLCMEAPRPAVARGAEFVIDLYVKDELALPGVKIRVVRVEDETVGCTFRELDRQTESLLNQRLHEEQKKGVAATGEPGVPSTKKVIKLSF
jgi:CheY-like chemotaxis protein